MTLAEAVETIKRYCEGRECEDCVFKNIRDGKWLPCSLGEAPCHWQIPPETNNLSEDNPWDHFAEQVD